MMTTWGIAAAAALSVTGADTISTGRDLIQAMHDRYADSWYETVRFEQTTTFFGADGSVARSETWQEFLHLPGRLRVELPGGRGLIFRNDSIYQLQDGAVANAAPQIHSLLVLGFDIYRQDPEATIARLEQAGFDLDRLRADRWNGRPVWVVGAEEGDERTAQFWVDRERLVFVRQLSATGEGVSEVRFEEYEPLAGGWISPQVLFLVNGSLRLREEYSEIRAGDELPEALFDPAAWAEADGAP